MNKFPNVIKWRVASVYNWADGACILCNLMRPIILGNTGFKHLSFHFSSSGMITLLLTIPFNCLWNELVGSALSLEKWLSEMKLLILSLNSLINGFVFMRYSFQLFGYSVPQKTLIYGVSQWNCCICFHDQILSQFLFWSCKLYCNPSLNNSSSSIENSTLVLLMIWG
jgi:hypothetical protein